MALLILLMSALCETDAQNLHFGAGVCAANYSGDITRDLRAIISQTGPGFGVHLGYEFDRYFGLRAGFEKLKVRADDARSGVDWQIMRNLNFSSDLYTADLTVFLEAISLITRYETRFSVQLTGGLTMFRFNPKTRWNGRDVTLRDLGTEGQGIPGFRPKYGLTSSALTFGTGAGYRISPHYSIRLLLLFRRTNTDYLDDLSGNYVDYGTLERYNGTLAAQLGNKINAPNGTKRGNPADDDWFQSLSLSLVFHLNDANGYAGGLSRKKSLHCPKF